MHFVKQIRSPILINGMRGGPVDESTVLARVDFAVRAFSALLFNPCSREVCMKNLTIPLSEPE